MEQPRRYVFRGNASGVAAHIRRPVDLLMPVQAASSLPTTGGLSESQAGPTCWGERKPTRGNKAITYVSFDSATTRAYGDYMDAEKAVAMTLGKLRFDEVPAQTTVSAEAQNLVMIERVAVGMASMTLQSLSTVSGEPPIRCESAKLEGVEVDGYKLTVTLAPEYYCEHDTMSKLAAAAEEGKDPQFFINAGRSSCYGFPNKTGMVLCTLVREMHWTDTPHPDAKIDGNSVIVPDFGRVYFGEMFVQDAARRLTMVRYQLGSADGGDGSGPAGDTNGSQWPPDGQ
jgi:hypothetical protein